MRRAHGRVVAVKAIGGVEELAESAAVEQELAKRTVLFAHERVSSEEDAPPRAIRRLVTLGRARRVLRTMGSCPLLQGRLERRRIDKLAESATMRLPHMQILHMKRVVRCNSLVRMSLGRAAVVTLARPHTHPRAGAIELTGCAPWFQNLPSSFQPRLGAGMHRPR